MSRKCCHSAGNKKKIITTALITAAAIGIFVLVFALSEKDSDGVTPLTLSPSDDVVMIPLAQLNNGNAHFYSYPIAGEKINFFVLRSSDGVVRAAFDTCDICYREKKGYRQEGDFMVCNNCNNKFRSTHINVLKGGCNPVPLERTVVGNDLIIKIADIKKGGFYF